MDVPHLYYASFHIHLMGSDWSEGRTIRRALSPGDLGPSIPGSGLTRSEGRKFTRVLCSHAAFVVKVLRSHKTMCVHHIYLKEVLIDFQGSLS